MKRLYIIALVATIAGCAANPYKQFYTSNYNKSDPNARQNVEFLAENQQPKIIRVSPDQVRDQVRTLVSQGYIVLGSSAYNGPVASEAQVAQVAKSVGATLAIHSASYAGTETRTRIESVGTISNTYGGGQVYGDVNLGYSGNSTTYGTQNIPVVDQIRRYEVSAVYMAKAPYPGKFGAIFVPLDPEMRRNLQRNTGAVVDIVMESFPAFYANLLSGDVVIEVNGKPVMDVPHCVELISSAMSSAELMTLKVVRNGQEIAIRVNR